MENIGIIGCGLVGQSWAIVFSTAGHRVRIHDNNPEGLSRGMKSILQKMEDLEAKGALRGSLSAQEAFKLIQSAPSIEQCVSDADYVQECVFEDFKLKQGVMAEAERFVRPSAILASSTGNIFPSRLSEGLKLKERIIVAHPLNPPHLVPLVEIIPAPWTAADVTSNARRLLASVGQEPIVARKETAGFIICRVQHAITAECFKLIRDDVVSVDDLDKLMPHGLGLRYAFLGALETSYLNANGIEHFCNMYGDAIYELQEQSGPPIRLEGATLQTIQQQIEQRIPLDKIDERRQWRDERLAELYRLKNKKSSE
ncbi:lambda-crystallin homolog [Mya arenaria]|uniref:lambda-crystallin homolog n=1 Tax=Mya arenaria TaxID=6604 RepID=UPI0022DF4BF8|nr:lambda-crystallin homolog [Mya arenaria]